MRGCSGRAKNSAAGRDSMISPPSMNTTRLATSSSAPVVVTLDEGYGGQPQLRTTLTFDRASGRVAKRETFESLSAGRQLRSWLRFAHTGEIYGLTGQTVAGLATAGGAVLVYTGVALALRRLTAWLRRRPAVAEVENSKAAYRWPALR